MDIDNTSLKIVTSIIESLFFLRHGNYTLRMCTRCAQVQFLGSMVLKKMMLVTIFRSCILIFWEMHALFSIGVYKLLLE